MKLLETALRIQAKLFSEVNSIIGHGTPKPEDFMKLPYTQNIIHETLRLDHHEVTPLPSLTLRPKSGLRMVIEERDAEAFEPGASNF
ncbi:cytochrome P450 [Peribacillus frigoritolerans]|uniref:cytochrome P450 n=1 Tax=Peribacillus frigoritolerans TaxID=450367 RepID=UPI003305A434